MRHIVSMSGSIVATLDDTLFHRLLGSPRGGLAELKEHLHASLGCGTSQLRFVCDGNAITDNAGMQDQVIMCR